MEEIINVFISILSLVTIITSIIGTVATGIYSIKKIMNYAVNIVHDFYKIKKCVSANTHIEK